MALGALVIDHREHAPTSARSEKLSHNVPRDVQPKRKRKVLFGALLSSYRTDSAILLLFSHSDNMVIFSLRKTSCTLIYWLPFS